MQSVDTDASFVYNESGLRVQKTVNGVVTNYTLHGKNIVHMTQGDNNLHFFYDASGKPAIVEYNGVKYAYVQNLQGDIVAILDSAGNKVVEYAYDAWGRPIKKEGSLAETLGTVQPFRYRGYVYDEETGVYYLRSRYFSSLNSRFLSMDCIIGKKQLLAHNLFAYCKNVVISKKDPNGWSSDEEDWLLSDYLDFEIIGESYIDNDVVFLIDNHYYEISIKEGAKGASTYVYGDSVHTAYRYDQTTTEKKQLYYTGQYDASSGNFTFLYENDMVSVSKDLVDYTIGYDYNFVFTNELLARNDNGGYSVAVERLQIALMGNDYADVLLDGIGYYGAHTQEAVTKLQRKKGLEVDGKAGPQVKCCLYPDYIYSISQIQ